MNATPVARPLSLFNKAFLPLGYLSAAAAAVTGAWGFAAVVLVGVVIAHVCVRRAQRGLGSTLDRVNAVQPYDERDRELMNRCYAALGMVVMVAQTVVFFVTVLLRGDVAGEAVRLLAVCAISIAVNTYVVKRS